MLLWGPPYWGANFKGLVLCGQCSHNWCLKQPGGRFCNLTFMSHPWESTSVPWLFLIFVYYEEPKFSFFKKFISYNFMWFWVGREREVSYFILEEINYASEKCSSSQGHTEGNCEAGHDHISFGSKVRSPFSHFSETPGKWIQEL